MPHMPHLLIPEDVPTFGDEMEGWLKGEDVSLASLLHFFGRRSFALAFVILMAPSALPIPTGGVTHVLEFIALVFAVQLLVGREDLWIPHRWHHRSVVGDGNGRLVRGLLRFIRWCERWARPRGTFLFGHRGGNVVFGLLVVLGAVGALVAPPFTGLDTLPSLGVVILSLGVLFRDVVIATLGIVVIAVGITIEIVLGAALINVATAFWPF